MLNSMHMLLKNILVSLKLGINQNVIPKCNKYVLKCCWVMVLLLFCSWVIFHKRLVVKSERYFNRISLKNV